ncbi:family 78 glycoside hydrolase catalytic domain [Microbacteriaceae bacterium VKM Ac-2855]|nr:family 78 glycoside hydrolase catalytic domain [Microbacteriaceae bacterium VKM Ac-2855]
MASRPHTLTTNGLTAPLGVATAQPRFAWSLPPGQVQESYELELYLDRVGDDRLMWASGPVASHRPFTEALGGLALRAQSQYRWRVRTDDGESTTLWSELADFGTGFLESDVFAGRWITAAETDSADRHALYFRSTIALHAPVVRARVYASGLGWYRLFVNHNDLTGPALVPRWTPFEESVEYQVYDASEALTVGPNVVGIAVADGRYRGTLGADSKDARYGERLAVAAEIVIDFADGSQQTIVTDETWTVGRGRIRRADPMLAVEVDLRIDANAWLNTDATLEDEASAILLPPHPRVLISEDVERVTEVARLRGTVSRAPSGAQVIDFGQNFAGVVSLTLAGPAGTTATITYGEVLTPDGEVDTEHLFARASSRPGKTFQRDEVVLADAPEKYQPWFTIRGFRYASVQGAYEIPAADVAGIVLSTAMAPISSFRASDHRLEQLWRNVTWSLRSNFTDTATDCPTRERSGWTGDIQVFGSTAVQLVAADNFLRRYLRNAAVEQYEDGRVPAYIPSETIKGVPNPMEYVATSVGWGDVTVVLPWTLYEYYGDTQVLRAQYPSARRWVEHLAARAASATRAFARSAGPRGGEQEQYIVDTGFHWGEWLRAGEEDLNTWWSSKYFPPAVVATAYFAHSASLLGRIADIIGETEDAAHYRDLAANAGSAWRSVFVRRNGARIGEDKQDDYVRALAFDLLLPQQRSAALNRLVELIEIAGDHLGTGFLSTPMLMPVLADGGRGDIAYRLLLQTSEPSWLAQIERGATTTWESWRGFDDDGAALDSHNHYAHGSVVRFLQEYIAGLAPAAPGYEKITFRPVIQPGLDWASVSINTPFGRASSAWTRAGAEVALDITVPAGTTGTVHLGEEVHSVGVGQHSFTIAIKARGAVV